jgi:probable HAF family extracellular repeat protein
MRSWFVALSLVTSAALIGAAPRSHQLSIVDLGTLGGRFSSASGINNRNQVVGVSFTNATGNFHGFLWQDDTMVDLGTLPGDDNSEANSINDHGQIAGTSRRTGVSVRAVVWDNGTIVDLGMSPGASFCEAHAINNHGQIAGECGFGDGVVHAVIWHHGQIVDLGAPPDTTVIRAAAINERGEVAGTDSAFHAFVWDGAMTDLGTLPGGQFSVANAITDHGQVIGHSTTSTGAFMAVIWEKGRVTTTLGMLPGTFNSQAYGVNKRLEIVGRSDQLPFLWSDGTMMELPTLPGGTQALPFAINDRGWAAGQGDTADNQAHAVLWMR